MSRKVHQEQVGTEAERNSQLDDRFLALVNSFERNVFELANLADSVAAKEKAFLRNEANSLGLSRG